MSESSQNYPRKLLAILSFAFGVLSTAVAGGVTFGQSLSDLSTAKERITELQKSSQQALEEYRATLKTWRDAYNTQALTLQTSQIRVQQLENDRCSPIKADIDSIYHSIDYAQQYDHAERLKDLNTMMDQYQQTLRSCYAASASSKS